jgi:hypothetical protein
MVNLRRDSSGHFVARKRLPDDVREAYGRRYGARFEAKFFRRKSTGSKAASRAFVDWQETVAGRIAAIRAEQRGDGIDPEPRDAAALAGEWYHWFVARYEKELGDHVAYDEAIWEIIDDMRDLAPEEIISTTWQRHSRNFLGTRSISRPLHLANDS